LEDSISKKIDRSTPQHFAETDAKMIDHLNVWYYFKYIFLTVFGNGFGDRIKKDAGKASPSAGS
jgi:hypothetical protein